jgi:hypothetical protein
VLDPGLGVCGQDAKHAAGAVRPQVHAGDEAVAEQERQDVVSISSLRGGGVELEPVAKAEEPLRPDTFELE